MTSLLLAAACSSQEPKLIEVGCDRYTNPYPDLYSGPIGKAVAKATPGSTIEICAGEYTDSLDLNAQSLTIRGRAGDRVVINTGSIYNSSRDESTYADWLPGFLIYNRSDIRLENLTIVNQDGASIWADQSQLNVRDVIFRNVQGNDPDFPNDQLILNDTTAVLENVAFREGGNITMTESDVTLQNSSLSDNQNIPIVVEEGTLSVVDSTFGKGAGFLQVTNGNLSVSGSRFGSEAETQVHLIDSAATFSDVTMKGYGMIALRAEGESDVVIENAAFQEPSEVYAYTTAIDQTGGNLSVSRSSFDRNTDGHVSLDDVTAQFDGVTFTNGSATQSGGSIWAKTSDLNVVNSTFEQNTATRSVGGAIYAQYSILDVANTTFESNTADMGGHVFLDYSIATLDHVIMRGGVSVLGGALYAHGHLDSINYPTSVLIQDSTFEENTAEWRGGALCFNNGHISIQDSQITENTAPVGAAINAQSQIYTKVEVAGGVIAGNDFDSSYGQVALWSENQSSGSAPIFLTVDAVDWRSSRQQEGPDVVMARGYFTEDPSLTNDFYADAIPQESYMAGYSLEDATNYVCAVEYEDAECAVQE